MVPGDRAVLSAMGLDGSGPCDAYGTAMDISLDRVIEAARRRLAAVTPEVAGYIVLRATRALEPGRLEVSTASVLLTESGEVLVRPGSAASEPEVEGALRGLLARLLELSTSPAPAITAVAAAAANSGLTAFTEELSAALIPLNHAAAGRALARLYRETYRAEGLAAALELEASPAGAGRLDEALLAAQAPPSVVEAPPSSASEAVTPAPAPLAAEAASWPEAPPIQAVAPLQAMPLERSDDPLRELDIDVDLEPEPELQQPVAWGAAAGVEPLLADIPEPLLVDIPEPLLMDVDEPLLAGASELRPLPRAPAAACRSDVQQLLQRFLPDARSDERMARTLLAMLDLDVIAAASTRAPNASVAPSAPR
jgi:hypothetical protein